MKLVTDSMIVPPIKYEQVLQISRSINQSKQACFLQPIEKENNKLKQVERPKLHQQSSLKRLFVANSPTPFFNKPEKQEKYKTKQVIIQAFIERGYGMNQFRQHVKTINFPYKVEYKEYAVLVTSIVTQAFRSIEKFIQSNCGILVEPLSKPNIRILYAILLNFRELTKKWTVNEEYFHTYTVFLLALYNLNDGPVEISALSAYMTYQAIMKLLMIRQKEVDPVRFDEKEKISVFKIKNQKMFYRKADQQENTIQRNQIHQQNNNVKLWGNEKQDQLALFYVELLDLARVRDRYRQIYGPITMFQNMNTLRSYFYKIIRKSLRRVQKITKIYPQRFSKETADMICLKQDDRYTQYVLTSPQFVLSRVLLCKMHGTKDIDTALILQISQSLQKGMSERMQTFQSS